MSRLAYYVGLLEDERRIAAFARAIAAVVRPGDHVLEIGAGLGTYALLAARAGARLVTAVERDPAAVSLARELGVERESGGRVRLVEADARFLTLPEPADVVIFEDFGAVGLHAELRPLFDHVRERLARPEARYLPARVELFLAPVDLPLRKLDPARPGAVPFSSGALGLLLKRSLNDPGFPELKPEHLLGPGAGAGAFTVDRPLPARLSGAGRAAIARAGRMTALAGWIKLHLSDREALDNSPASPPASWKTLVLPFEEPLEVRAGETAELSLEIASGPSPGLLLMKWKARLGPAEREGCSANGLPGDSEWIRRGTLEHVPPASRFLPVVAEICRAADGRRGVAEIAASVYANNAALFRDRRSAELLVVEVLDRLQGLTQL